MPLRIAAKIDPVDEEYFTEEIQPPLRDPLVEFVGAIGEAQKEEFLGNACAYLFPINWPEPFGITMIEAMACGTPVIAMSHGVNSRGQGRRAHRVHVPIHYPADLSSAPTRASLPRRARGDTWRSGSQWKERAMAAKPPTGGCSRRRPRPLIGWWMSQLLWPCCQPAGG